MWPQQVGPVDDDCTVMLPEHLLVEEFVSCVPFSIFKYMSHTNCVLVCAATNVLQCSDRHVLYLPSMQADLIAAPTNLTHHTPA